MRAWVIARMVWLDLWRRKDAYVFLALLTVLLLALSAVNVFNLDGVGAHTLEWGLLLTWLAGWGLSVMTACRLLPEEEARGTIFSLLARPVRRVDVLLGKWLGAWLATSVAVGVCLLLVAGVATSLGVRAQPAALAQAWLLFAGAQGIVIAMGLLMSTRLHRDAAASMTLVLSGAAYLVVPQIPVWLLRETGWRHDALLAVYHVLPHFELFDLRLRVAHGYGPVGGTTLAAAIGYALAQLAFWLALAHVSYARRRFSRDRLTE